MSDLPWLGKSRGTWENWLCGYARTPADPVCHQDATWHGIALDGPAEHIAAMMSSCDEHLPQMKLTADYAHRMRHPCAIPGSWFRWPENECYTDWDEPAEFAALASGLAGIR